MATLGNNRKAYIALGSSGNPTTWLAGEQTNSFNRTAEAIEVSDKSSEWAQFIAGKKGSTAEITVFTDDTSGEPQYNAIKALHTGANVRVFIGTLSDQNAQVCGDVFTGVITAVGDTNDTGAVATRNISITVTGEVTHVPEIPADDEEE